MKSILKSAWERFFKIARNTFFFLTLLVVAAFNYLPQFYSSFKPPIESAIVDYEKSYKTTGEYLQITGNEPNLTETIVKTDIVVLYGSFDKKRCKFSSVIATGYSKERGKVSLDLDFRDRQSGGQSTNREEGYQQYGPWFLTMTPRDDIWGIQLTAVHTCGPEVFHWVTYTKQGEILMMNKLRSLP